MAREKDIPEIYEENESGGALGKILAAIFLYGAALLLGYLVFAVPEAGTAMGAIRGVLTGLGGSLAVVIPVMLIWIATLTVFSARGKKIAVWRCILNGLLFLCLFTGVHLFFAESIIDGWIPGFGNFVDKSWRYGHGGGALGALLGWPLFHYLGKWGGLLVVILIAVLSLTATGKTVRFIRWSRARAEDFRHRSEQSRIEKESEQMFDLDDGFPRRETDFDRDERARRRPVRRGEAAPERERPVRRGDVTLEHERPVRREEDGLRPARPRRTESADAVRVKPEPRRRPAAEAAEVAAPERTKPEPAPKKRKMYRETVAEAVPEERMAAEAPAEDVDALFDVEVTAAEEARRESRRKNFKPDTSKAVEEMRRMKAKDGQVRMDEDLRIEPEVCDVLENDDPPFDIPDRKPAPMKKLKRVPVPEEIPEEEYNYPPIDLLEESVEAPASSRDQDMEKAKKLEDTLSEFGISSKLTGIAHGPAVTRFELQPAPGVKVSRITALADDIAMRLAAMSVRIEAPIPGKAAVGVEIPNEKVEMVRLRDVLESAEARKSVSKVAVGLGKDNSGRYIVADIAKMPHVLIAGQTGSGKSVCINSIITSILFRATPDEVRLILIDPKMVELSIYNDIPHLICPVVTDAKKAASALDWAVAEMSMRYKKFAERGVRDIKGFNKALKDGEKQMPQMVIVIDELADLMMVAPGEVEESICRLAQLARAAGMHLVIATQRPSVNVITGVIKANIPTRIAFSVASQIDSRTMIDHGGAEKLLGNGDMLFVPSGINKPMRVQGAWVSDEEVHAITSYIKERSEVAYDADMIEQMNNSVRSDAEKEDYASEYDPRLPEAVEIVVEAGQASVSMLQRRMRVGYARAGRLIDEMEQRGIVSEADGAKPRTVLITRDEMDELFEE